MKSTTASFVRRLAALVSLLTGSVFAQDAPTIVLTTTDGQTPPALNPGAPSGGYDLAGMERIDPLTGRLSFAVPLLRVGGRGEAGYTIYIPITAPPWRFEHIAEVGSTTAPSCRAYYWFNLPRADWWNPAEPGYTPGTITGRRAGEEVSTCNGNLPFYLKTFTHLVFTAADGSEHKLYDALNKGVAEYVCANPPPPGSETSPNRGAIFEARDGSGITFESTTDIYDDRSVANYEGNDGLFIPNGTLKFPNGVQYNFDIFGRVTSIRDRNGNTTTLTYSATGYPSTQSLESVTDPLGRVIRFTDTTTARRISYSGADGATRVIQIGGPAPLRSDYVGQTSYLFPDMYFDSGRNPPISSTVGSITLPNNKQFRFFTNRYGELARVELPTGGAVEYDHDGGLVNGYASGQVGEDFSGEHGPETCTADPPVYVPPPYKMFVYRRLVARRLYDGPTLQSTTTYSRPEQALSQRLIQIQYTEPVVVETVGPDGTRLGATRHYYWTSPGDVKAIGNGPADNINFYTWLRGYDGAYGDKEYRTEALGSGTTVLRQTDTNWELGTGQYGVANVSERTTTLSDTGQVSRQTMLYDQYNNRTELAEYDYDGSMKRRTVTTYVTDPAYTGTTVHLRALPNRESVYDGTTESSRTTYSYDHDNNADPRGNVTKTSVWLKGPDESMSSAREVSTLREYDGYGNVTQITDPRQTVATIQYSSTYNGACPTTVTKAGRTVTAECDLRTDPVNPGQWAGTGKLTSVTDPNGVQTTYAYADPLDRVTAVVRAANKADATSTRFTYDDALRIVTTTADRDNPDDRLLKTEAVYDTLGREVESRKYVNASDYHSVLKRYDGLGRLWQVSNPGDDTCWTVTEYDLLGRPKAVTTCDGAVSTTTYAGNAVTMQDQAGKRRRSSTDALGRLTQVIENPDASPAYAAAYTYDPLDNLTDVLHGDWSGTNILNAQSRSFRYDSHKRLVRATNPESGTVEYEYDDNGNLVVKRALRAGAAAVVTCYGAYSSGTCNSAGGYDAFNRVLRKSYSDGTPGVTFEYDTDITIAGHAEANYPVGRLTKVTTAASATAFRYDALGRAAASRQTTGTGAYVFGYGYSRAGALQSMTYPSGRIASYTFNGAGQIESASFGGSSVASGIAYTPHGAITDLTLGNGRFESVLYNRRLQPYDMKLGASAGSSDLWRLVNGYGGTDNNGNVLVQEITAPGWATPLRTVYKYDPFNRLWLYAEGAGNESAEFCSQASAPLCQKFTYDAWGNRLIAERTGVGPSLSEPNTFSTATNRISTSGFVYDDFGNLTSTPAGTAQYDAENRMTSATTALGTTQYVYDGEGQRVKKIEGTQETVYVYNAMGQLAAEYGGAPATVAGRTYLTQDHLGSTRVVTDAGGTVVERRDYLPFGDEIPAMEGSPRLSVTGYTNAAATTLKFTGKERDAETGLDYFGARYFSGAQGRFTSPDPIHFQAEMLQDPQRLNLYAYVRNNPLRLVDPKGEETELRGTEEERRKILEALRSAVGSQAGKYLREKTVKSWFGLGKTRYVVEATSQKAFAKANAVAGEFAAIIQSKKTVNIGIVPAGTTVKGDVGGSVKIAAFPQGSEGTTGPIGGGLGIRLLDPSAAYGNVPGILMSDSRSSPADPGLVVAHELGHAWGMMTGDWKTVHGNPFNTDDPALRLENKVRENRNPSGPTRILHDAPVLGK